MKYYIIAGEASGDLHGSNLMKALQKVDVNAKFRFWGVLVVHDKNRGIDGGFAIHSNHRFFL